MGAERAGATSPLYTHVGFPGAEDTVNYKLPRLFKKLTFILSVFKKINK